MSREGVDIGSAVFYRGTMRLLFPALILAGAGLALAQPAAMTPPAAPPPAAMQAEDLYRRGLSSREQARAARGEAAARKAGSADFQRVLADFPQSPVTDDAALALAEDGFCLTDAGYPECVAHAIRGYESFLRSYPNSDRRAYVLRRMTGLYLELAGRYDQDRPWRSPERAELCRGRALELADLLAAEPSADDAQFGRETAAQIRGAGRPFSVVPGGRLPR